MIQSCYCLCMQTLYILFKIIRHSSYSWIFTFQAFLQFVWLNGLICDIIMLWDDREAHACPTWGKHILEPKKISSSAEAHGHFIYLWTRLTEFPAAQNWCFYCCIFLYFRSYYKNSQWRFVNFFFLFGLLEVQLVIMCKIRG